MGMIVSDHTSLYINFCYILILKILIISKDYSNIEIYGNLGINTGQTLPEKVIAIENYSP